MGVNFVKLWMGVYLCKGKNCWLKWLLTSSKRVSRGLKNRGLRTKGKSTERNTAKSHYYTFNSVTLL